MVMDIKIEPIDISFDRTSRYYAYTVHDGNHRILTVTTDSTQTLSKWLNDLLKSTAKTNHNPILVGISAERELVEYTKRGVKDQPYDIITLCVGSQCLIYHLDTCENTYGSRDSTLNRPLRAFFENPGVIAVGMEMEAVVKKMARDHGIKIKNAVDLRALAAKKVEQLDLARYDLNKVAITVLGKHVDVVKPEKKVEWYDDYLKLWSRNLTTEKVRFATVDAYLCLLLGSEMYDVMVHGDDGAKAKKKNVVKAKILRR